MTGAGEQRDDVPVNPAKWIEANVPGITFDEWQRQTLGRVYYTTDGTRDAAVAVATAGPTPDGKGWVDVGSTDAGGLDLAPVIGDHNAAVRSMAASTLVPRTVTFMGPGITPAAGLYFGLEEEIVPATDDGMHPASRLAWEQVVEGRGPDGEPLVVCDHCGEPAPCTEGILRHMNTDGHRLMCVPTGRCYVAERPTSELPTR